MIHYSCVRCEAVLNVPPTLDLSTGSQPVRLQCPHCGAITAVSFRVGELKRDEPQGPSLFQSLRLRHWIGHPFLKEAFDEDTLRKGRATLGKYIFENIIQHEKWTSFNALMLGALVALVAAAWSLSAELDIYLKWIPYVGSILATLIAIFASKGFARHYYGRQFTIEEKRQYENLLMIALAAQLYLLLRACATLLLTQISFIPPAGVALTADLPTFPVWLLLCAIIFLVTLESIWYYIVLLVLLINIFIFNFVAVTALLKIGPLHMPWLQVFPPILFAMQLGVPLFTAILFRLYAWLRPRHFHSHLFHRTGIFIRIQLAVVALSSLLAVNVFDFSFFFAVFFLATVGLAWKTSTDGKLGDVQAVAYLTWLNAANIAMLVDAVPTGLLFGLSALNLFAALLPILFEKLRSHPLAGLDLVFEEKYRLDWTGWRLIALSGSAMAAHAIAVFWYTPYWLPQLGITFLWGVCALVLYHYQSSAWARHAPWAAIGSPLFALPILAEWQDYGGTYFMIAVIAVALAYVWKTWLRSGLLKGFLKTSNNLFEPALPEVRHKESTADKNERPGGIGPDSYMASILRNNRIYIIAALSALFGATFPMLLQSSCREEKFILDANKEPVKLDKETNARAIQIQGAFNEVFRAVAPAVVSIFTEQNVKLKHPFFNDPIFRDFFGGGPQSRKQTGLGSGFIINRHGFIVTNHHVAGAADTITVQLNNGRKYPAKLIGSDETSDIALLKIDAGDDLPFAYIGDSDQVKVGDWGLALGNPFGLAHTFTVGVISATSRQDLGSGDAGSYLQTDASINPGNSGGPLINIRGQVVGINRMIYSQSGGSVGIGFAIPINDAKVIIEQLRTKRKVVRGWLGVQISELDEAQRAKLGVPTDAGILVQQAVKGGPARSAGIKPGDVIVSIGSEKITAYANLRRAILQAKIGQVLDVTVYRQGGKKSFKVKITEVPSD